MNNSNRDNEATMRSAWRRAHGDKYWQYFEPFLKQMFAEQVMETHKETFQRLASDDSDWKPIKEAGHYDPELKREYVCDHCGQSLTPDDEGAK